MPSEALERIEAKYSCGTRVNVDVVKLARALEDQRNVLRAYLSDIMGMWHQCRLKKAERGIPVGTLCDNCREYVEGAVKDAMSDAERTLEEVAGGGK